MLFEYDCFVLEEVLLLLLVVLFGENMKKTVFYLQSFGNLCDIIIIFLDVVNGNDNQSLENRVYLPTSKNTKRTDEIVLTLSTRRCSKPL